MAKTQGRCLCGAVSFEYDGPAIWRGHCHCESCRRASGSVMTTFAGFRPAQVKFTGAEPSCFRTDDGVTRSFCPRCGSPIAYENAESPDQIHLQLGLFDDLEQMAPQDHSFRNEKPSWLRADENLPDSGYSFGA